MYWKFVLLAISATTALSFGNPREYQQWHDECRKTDDVATIDKYIAKFQEKLAKNPEDHLAKVYMGSAYTLRSKNSSWGPGKLDYLKKGGKLIDEAAGAAWTDPRVRFIRAANAYNAPRRFKRRPVAVKDFTWLLPIAIEGKGDLTKRERQAVLYYAWRTFDEEGDKEKAARAKSNCNKIDPGTWYGKQTA